MAQRYAYIKKERKIKVGTRIYTRTIRIYIYIRVERTYVTVCGASEQQHSRRIIIEERMRKPRVHDITIRDTYTLGIGCFFNVRSRDNAMRAFQATNYINRELYAPVSRAIRAISSFFPRAINKSFDYNNIIFIARLYKC